MEPSAKKIFPNSNSVPVKTERKPYIKTYTDLESPPKIAFGATLLTLLPPSFFNQNDPLLPSFLYPGLTAPHCLSLTPRDSDLIGLG